MKRPRRKSRRSPHPRARKTARKGGKVAGGRGLRVFALGRGVSIDYKRADGRTYRHKFAGRPAVYLTEKGRQLIVTPVSPGVFME